MNIKAIFRNPTILLGLILALAAALRIYHLGFESYWVDEIYAFHVTDGTLWKTITYQDVHPPLYYVLVHFWIDLFGRGEVALRSMSVLFGLLGVWLIYRLGKTLFGVSAGLVAAYLLTLSKFHIHYSQEARSYAMYVLVSLASFYFMAQLFQKGQRKHFVRYFAATLLMLYTHNYAIWSVAFQNLFVFVMFLWRPRDQKIHILEWLGWQALMFVVYLPWFLTFLGHAGDVKEGFSIARPTLSDLQYTLLEYTGGGKLLLLYLISALVCASSFIKVRGSELRAIIWLLGWFGVSLLAPYVVSLFWAPIFYTRYTIVSSLPYYLLLAFMGAKLKPLPARWAVWVLATILLVSSVAQFHTEVRKEQWREATAYMDSLSRPGDFVVFSRAGYHVYKFYTAKNDCEGEAFPKTPEQGVVNEYFKRVAPDNIHLVDAVVAPHRRVWLVVSHSRDKDELIPKRLLSLGYREVEKRYFGPAELDNERYVNSRQIFVSLYEK